MQELQQQRRRLYRYRDHLITGKHRDGTKYGIAAIRPLEMVTARVSVHVISNIVFTSLSAPRKTDRPFSSPEH